MKKRFLPILAFVLACGFYACKPTQKISSSPSSAEPKADTIRFTGHMVDHFKITDQMVMNDRARFILEDSIVLVREATDLGSSMASDGKFILKDNVQTETIVFPKGAKGQCFYIDKDDKLFVTFRKKGTPNREDFYLIFGPDRDLEDGDYIFMAKRDSSGRSGRMHIFYKVQYGENTYRVVYGLQNHLLFNPRILLGYDKRIIEGIQ